MRKLNLDVVRSAGFTLVELMIVVLIVSILLAIAIPTYQYEVRKGRRTDAKTAVLDLAGREERYYAASNAYTIDTSLLGYTTASSTTWGLSVGSGYYQITAAAGGTGIATSFVASVVPTAASPQLKDTPCQYFSVDNTGTQLGGTSAGAAVTSSPCWQ